MRRIVFVVMAAFLVAGCYQTPRDAYVTRGAVLGGATGAIIGGATTSTWGGALAGGAIGAVAGGLISSALAPPAPCYVRTKRGKWRAVRCY
jgi:hypothetical protein